MLVLCTHLHAQRSPHAETNLPQNELQPLPLQLELSQLPITVGCKTHA